MRLKVFSIVLVVLVLFSSLIVFSEDTKVQVIKNQSSVEDTTLFEDGDIIFQSSMSGQSYAIQLATGSKYSHCGMIFKENGEYFVYEAVQPVKKTLLMTWITHGDDNHYVVKRLKEKDSILTAEKIKPLKYEILAFMGKNYDLTFEWSDQRIYCSELVWKAYNRSTGLEIGKLQELASFDLTHPVVEKKLKERYGDNIPLDEKVISPGAIFESDLLETVKEE